MGRKPSIWWRASHGAWYVTLNGRKIRLSEDKKEAEKKFHQHMLLKGKVELSNETVSQLCDLYLSTIKGELSRHTFRSYRQYLQEFCNYHGSRVASDLKPIDLTTWISRHPDWKDNTKRQATLIVKIWAKWCKDQRVLPDNPFTTVSVPQMKRRKPPPPGALEKFLASIINPRFRELVNVSLLLGTRPGELCSLVASQIDLTAGVAIVKGKTGERKVMVPDAAKAILEPLMKRWPEGPILRNTIDKPWSQGSINSQMQSVSRRAGITGIVFYHTRGAFATRAIKNGVHPLLVSKLMGHADPKIVYQYYEQLNDDDLREAVEKASRTASAGSDASGESSREGGTPAPG